MPTLVKIKATAGDSLCSLAVNAGLLNCAPLRALPENGAFLEKALKGGEEITIPGLHQAFAEKSANATHVFRQKNSPPFSIRFVHGSPDRKYLQDFTLSELNISNYETDLAGNDGLAIFPNKYEFQKDGHADPDTFKVEVVDPGAGGSVNVLLEALRPVYGPGGAIVDYLPFEGAGAARKLEVVCQKVSSGVAYRSKYLRLVAHEADQQSVPEQTLLVTDATGEDDTIEILDQQVRATYVYSKCPAQQCPAVAQMSVGADKRRLRISFHVFRSAPGGQPVTGVSEEDSRRNLRRRACKWCRRILAPANIAPRLVEPYIEFLDPPPADTLVISQDHGLTSSGVTAAGEPSRLAFILSVLPPAPPGAAKDTSVNVNLAPGMTPRQVGEAVAAALPAGYRGVVFENARATDAANGSSDVQISRDDGTRVMIRQAETNDTRLTVQVAWVDIKKVNSVETGITLMPTTAELRRLVRCASGDDRLRVFVIGGFTEAGVRGRAFMPGLALAAEYRPQPPLRFAAVLTAAAVGSDDRWMGVMSHEASHVLGDHFHVSDEDECGPNQLMYSDTTADDSLSASRRVSDAPLLLHYGMYDPAQPTPGAVKWEKASEVELLRTRGQALLEGW